jgi:hypothetical protein
MSTDNYRLLRSIYTEPIPDVVRLVVRRVNTSGVLRLGLSPTVPCDCCSRRVLRVDTFFKCAVARFGGACGFRTGFVVVRPSSSDYDRFLLAPVHFCHYYVASLINASYRSKPLVG